MLCCTITGLFILAYIMASALASPYHCRNCNLARIPASIPPETTHLYLQGNQISSISRSTLVPLTQLTMLDVSRNKLIHMELGSFSGLKIAHLVLSNNQLNSVPHIEPLINSLTSLDLRNNLITTIQPYTFTNFTALRNLYFTSNSITSIPDFALQTPFAQLWRLLLDRNHVAMLNNYSFAGINARYLILRNNELTEFPCLNNITWLHNVDLSGNPISSVPFRCGQWWSKLQKLVLTQTRLTSFDNITKYTTGLRHLEATQVSINISKDTFRNTHDLYKVIIRDVNRFPWFYSNKAVMDYIELGGKSMDCIDEEQLHGMNAVRTFRLSQTSVVLVPHPGCSNKSFENGTAHGYFKSLKSILIEDSNLEKLPSLQCASKLVSMYLRRNRIRMVDDAQIHGLPALYDWKLSHNNITYFPNLTFFGSNNSLTILELHENKIPSIPCFPDEIKLYNLVRIILHDNIINYICNINFAPNIEYIDLTRNAITGNIFKGFTTPQLNLHSISTRFNNLDIINDSDLRYIQNCQVLRMEHNKIKQFPTVKLIATSAVHIDLRENLIPDVPCDTLDEMEKLTALYLDDNTITYMCPLLLTFAPKLSHLGLSDNRLLEMPDLRLPVRMQPTRVSLHNNPFRCVVTMCWMLFVPHDNPLMLEFGNTRCRVREDSTKYIVAGLTAECTCKIICIFKDIRSYL